LGRVSAVPQRSSRWVAFALVSGYTAVAAILGVVLLALSAPASVPAQPQPPPVAGATPPISTPTTVPPTTNVAAATGFTAVTGSNGVATVIPSGWRLGSCTAPDCSQVDDPADPRHFLRFGATPSRGGSLLDQQTAYEREFSTGRVNFQRVKLDPVAHRGHEAVDWEFEYDLNGVRRHVKTLLWRANGEDNWIYASAELTRWPETREIYDRMVDAAKP
jgi:hypothetical protein